jgi:hypothetical protein
MGKKSGTNAYKGGSGGTAVDGYEYQIDVSVWLALDLVLASRLTEALVLEPSSEEDVEADIVTSEAKLDGYRLIVQAKLRGGDAWTVLGIDTLLHHGTNRPSAAERLKDPDARYLLVTSAGLNGGIRGLQVRNAANWPKPEGMPKSIAKSMPADAAGRVAIIAKDEERLAIDIKASLAESFRVPHAKIASCVLALREAARARIRGVGDGRWTRAELERVVRVHEGYIASSPELEHYVPPTNWSELRSAMATRHAALIIGQSGTGKTLATLKLYDELRAEIPGLARVAIKTPEQLSNDNTAPPVLYDIEDPWGRYSFEPQKRDWNDQLATFFSSARSDRLVVATSRLDVALASGALEDVSPWRVKLEAEHYGKPERQRLYRTRIGALPRDLQLTAEEHEAGVLAKLATPLEIQKFFDALPTLPEEERKNPAGLVGHAVRVAHQSAIEGTVRNQIEARNDVAAAALVWGLLKVGDKVSLGLLRRLEDDLPAKTPPMEQGVMPLVLFFVAARNFRQTDSSISYYHPRVEGGMEVALERAPSLARRMLSALIDALALREGPDASWGVPGAARLVQALNDIEALNVSPTAASQAKIDAWLARTIAQQSDDFERVIGLAKVVGSPESNVAEAARFLLHRPRDTFGFSHVWGPLMHDEAWHARMRADPAVRAMIEHYIEDVLPQGRDDVGRNFVDEVERLAPDLTASFLLAAEKAVHWGYLPSSEAISAGALRNLKSFEAIVDAAIAVRTPTEAERERIDKLDLAITNGEYSDEYAEHLADNDDGTTAGDFLEAYVVHVRGTGDWPRLAAHRQLERLRFWWFRQLANDKERDAAEFARAFELGYGTVDEDDLWVALTRIWDASFEPQLVQRLQAGHDQPRVRSAALMCVSTWAPARLPEVCALLASSGQTCRLVEMANELGQLREEDSVLNFPDGREVTDRAAALLPAALRSLSDAAKALAHRKVPKLSKGAFTLLASVESPSETVRQFRLQLDQHFAMPVQDDVRWTLVHADASHEATLAMKAAIRYGMDDVIANGLSHRFAHVVALALTAIGESVGSPLPDALLALATHAGSPVRQSLAALLDARPHVAHVPALLILAGDRYSQRSMYDNGDEDYPIAQAAALAIAKLDALEDGPAGELFTVALATRDPNVRRLLFVALVRVADSPFQHRLWDLVASPGGLTLRRAAARALLVGHDRVTPAVIDAITPDLVATLPVPVAVDLALLLAINGEPGRVVEMANALAANEHRRVLVLMLVRMLHERDPRAARRIVRLLPADHEGVRFALGKIHELPGDAALEDLGDAASVKAVVGWLKVFTARVEVQPVRREKS